MRTQAKILLLIITAICASFTAFGDTLTSLLDIFKKYEVTESKHHEGNLYEHSLWVYKALNKWWDQNSPWVEGINAAQFKRFSIIAGLIHDMGKAGDLFYFYTDKKQHPTVGMEMITKRRPFYYVDKNNKSKTFDVVDMLKNDLKLSDDEIKLLALIVGLHWEFGSVLDESSQGIKDEAEKINVTKLPDEVLFERYLNSVYDKAVELGIDPKLINEEMLKLLILVSAADVKGANPVSYKKDIFKLPDADRVRSADDQVFQKYKFDTFGYEIRKKLLEYFQQHKAALLSRATNKVDFKAFESIEISKNIHTQSGAQLSMDYVKDSVIETFGPLAIAENSKYINKMLENESKYEKTHYVFYHAAPKQIKILSDILTDIYEKEIFPDTIKRDNFRLLRYARSPLYTKFKNKDEFIDYEVRNFNVVHDTPSAHDKPDWNIQSYILSSNLFIFGNATPKTKSECSFDYFISNKERASANLVGLFTNLLSEEIGINRKNLDRAIDLSYYIKKFQKLSEILNNKEGAVFQIFIPKNKVDRIAYFARNYGQPFGNTVALNYLFNRDVAKEDRLPRFWQLLDKYPDLALKVDSNYSKISKILDKFKADPRQFPNSLRWQARLLFTDDVLLSRNSGVIIKTFTTDNDEAKKLYKAERKKFLDKLMAELKAPTMPAIIDVKSLDEIITMAKDKKIIINSKTLVITNFEGVLVSYSPLIEKYIASQEKNILDFTNLDKRKSLALIKYTDALTQAYKNAYPDEFAKSNQVIKTTKIDNSPAIVEKINDMGAITLAISSNDLTFSNFNDDYGYHNLKLNFQNKIINKIFPDAPINEPIIFGLDNLSSANIQIDKKYELVDFGYINNILYTGMRPFVVDIIRSFFHKLGYLILKDGDFKVADKFNFENLVFIGDAKTNLDDIFNGFGKYFNKAFLLRIK